MLWYQIPFASPYPRVTDPDAKGRGQHGTITLQRYELVQPVRRYHLPKTCWLHDIHWDESEDVACYSEHHGGYFLIPSKFIDFKR